MKGKKRDLEFEYGLGGSIDMRVSRELGALVPAYSVQSALHLQRQSLYEYSFGDASNLRGRALKGGRVEERGRRTGRGQATAAGEFLRWKRD
jgi:hypothetical protein